ncbi:MAG: hypothetical protein HXS41_00510 [Theionarchaea archaeon]|nr:hypothetical protein [Theionarchaea archaeon]MBU6999151.1 hypothetical protein [Theionarchaea archaeon]MBU7019512.1 hypothetical protein [Theionarchaea archaeon]MBU7034944.1 hypothetical protein [Theionarchaea archaeon]MBU7040774.1 hypothetical protein [Theionarchaea archaeon]
MAEEYQITDRSVIKFHDLFKGEEEDGLVLVGRRDIGSYVSLPVEAYDVIDLLDSGKTVGEVKTILEAKYGEEAEIEDFIEDMISNEMVHYVDDYEIPTTSELQKDVFSGITGRHVGWLFSPYAWVVYGVLAAGCLILFASHPQYIPQPADFFWHPWYSVAVGLTFFFGWILVAFHELAHLFAAKAVGTEGYFSLSNRLIFVVAQTNLGNIWTIPREKRYIVYLAGMAWDSVMVFLCLLLLLLSDSSVIHLDQLVYAFVKAIIFIKVWGIIWQFRFNMQTDVYYVVANYFRCRNLLGDAQARIKNTLSTFVSRIEKTDFTGTPPSEMRAIKWYTPLYFVGTAVTLATYLLRNLPLLLLQIRRALDGILTGYHANHALFIDAIVLVILTSFNFGLLGFLVLRPRWQGVKQWLKAR